MDELSTAPIPGPIRAEEHRQPRAQAARRHLEKRLRGQDREIETNEPDEPVEIGEPEHHIDISV
jgi:hypothetical protein